MNRQDLINLGFQELPHFTVNNSLLYDLGRRKYLSVGSTGTPNEMLFIYERNEDNPQKINDIIVLHNYDYDGLLTKKKISTLIKALKWQKTEEKKWIKWIMFFLGAAVTLLMAL